jgi:hypothetical protein
MSDYAHSQWPWEIGKNFPVCLGPLGSLGSNKAALPSFSGPQEAVEHLYSEAKPPEILRNRHSPAPTHSHPQEAGRQTCLPEAVCMCLLATGPANGHFVLNLVPHNSQKLMGCPTPAGKCIMPRAASKLTPPTGASCQLAEESYNT